MGSVFKQEPHHHHHYNHPHYQRQNRHLCGVAVAAATAAVVACGDEERHIDRALKQCKQLEHTLRLSLVQVKLLNRKYCWAPLANNVTAAGAAIESPLSVRQSLSETQLKQSAARQSSTALRFSASTPEIQRSTAAPAYGIRPSIVYRPLNVILLQSNEITVQLIKIRRHFEGILLRVEFLVRTYCKKSATAFRSPMAAIDRRRFSAQLIMAGAVQQQQQRQRRRFSDAAATDATMVIAISRTNVGDEDATAAAVDTAALRYHGSCARSGTGCVSIPVG